MVESLRYFMLKLTRRCWFSNIFKLAKEIWNFGTATCSLVIQSIYLLIIFVLEVLMHLLVLSMCSVDMFLPIYDWLKALDNWGYEKCLLPPSRFIGPYYFGMSQKTGLHVINCKWNCVLLLFCPHSICSFETRIPGTVKCYYIYTYMYVYIHTYTQTYICM